MSWSASYLFDGNDAHEVQIINVTSDEANAALQAAFDASFALIGTNTLGTDKKFKVVLSGHSNPGHEPVAGWSNDCLTINIYQLGEPA